MATIFDSNVPDVGSDDLFLTDAGKRIQMRAWAVNNLMTQTSLADAKTILGIMGEIPHIEHISTADATDLASAITLVNALKAKFNEFLQTAENANHIASE
ncbi:hypothetical protein [Rouxiella badensis]|uniref:hypothetical protein n=1 Tax=Rouxiella badensis TaxID=1646377 RepID=UPI003C4DDB42